MSYETDDRHETYEAFHDQGGPGAFEAESDQDAEAAFGEEAEMDLAAELLDTGSEAEMDQFLQGLVKRAGGAWSGWVRSPEGRQLVGLLRGAAKKALPGLGAAVGSHLGGPEGARLGRQASQQAGRIFGLELEGLSPEDQEFEVARRFVRCAGAAARQLVEGLAPSPRQALQTAARTFAPGLLAGAQELGYGPGPHPVSTGSRCGCAYGGRRSGRWVKIRGRIVLL